MTDRNGHKRGASLRDRACGLRPEPRAASQPEALVPCAALPDVSRLTMVQLDARVRAANRWLDLPGAHHWPDQKATEEAYLRACWEEMRRRRGSNDMLEAAE